MSDNSLNSWLTKVKQWDFNTVVPAHLDAPLSLSPSEFAEPFEAFSKNGGNEVRFCDEDVALLREAELGPLSFSVGKTKNGPLTGVDCNLDNGDGDARVVSKVLNLKWTPK